MLSFFDPEMQDNGYEIEEGLRVYEVEGSFTSDERYVCVPESMSQEELLQEVAIALRFKYGRSAKITNVTDVTARFADIAAELAEE